MKITTCNKSALVALLALGVLAFGGSAKAQTIVYEDNFTGSSSTSLNGLAPTIDNGPNSPSDTWTVASENGGSGQFNADGSFDAQTTEAYLPASFTSGYIYTLSADLNMTSGQYLTLEFGNNDVYATTNELGIAFNNVGSLQYFTNGGDSTVTYGSVPNGELAQIILNTTGGTGNWVYSYEYGGVLLNSTPFDISGGQQAALTNMPVGFTTGLFADAQGSVSNFSLTQATASVPEPGTIWSAALGLLGLVGYQVRRNRLSRS